MSMRPRLGSSPNAIKIENFDVDTIKGALEGLFSVPLRPELKLDGEENIARELSEYVDWLVEKMKDPFGKIIIGEGDSEKVLSFALGEGVGKIGSYELDELESAGKKFEEALVSQLIYKINANNTMGAARHIVNNLGKIMFGATFDAGNTTALEYAKGNTGQQGFGLFIEEFLFGTFAAMQDTSSISQSRSDPTHDLGKLNTEIKSTMGYDNVIQDVTIGSAKFNIGGAIEKQLGNFPGSRFRGVKTGEDLNAVVLSAVMTTYRIAKKMSNFILIRNVFYDTNKTLLPFSPTKAQKEGENYNPSKYATNLQMTDMGSFGISDMFLFMGLLIYELWKEVLNDMTIPNTVNNRSLVAIGWTMKKTKTGVALELKTSYKSKSEKSIEAGLEAYKFEKLYARRLDLLNMARGGSKAFRSALFGMVRYGNDWIRMPKEVQ